MYNINININNNVCNVCMCNNVMKMILLLL